ncbi:hypothetical protein KY290_037125 [Solanum tuberosum]|uniref:Uncharacterized protein n=1 Tax=Solanum tuberosum TaxID=4113 RepID=A0ABQ7TV88_SOLTU|nr:hypothetical protein KY285_036450 [Solanum tuberosum]KAH0738420.1 hypothetical protein KY290_037125 [Solanum tuberosum]
MRIRYGAGGVISTHSIDGCDWKLLNELEGQQCCQLGRDLKLIYIWHPNRLVQFSTRTRPTTYRLSPEVYEHRKNYQLCFRCGDKYAPGYKFEEQALIDVVIEVEIQLETQEAICPSALAGNHNREALIALLTPKL